MSSTDASSLGTRRLEPASRATHRRGRIIHGDLGSEAARGCRLEPRRCVKFRSESSGDYRERSHHRATRAGLHTSSRSSSSSIVGRPVPRAVRLLPVPRDHRDVHPVGQGKRGLPGDLRPFRLQGRLARPDEFSPDRVRRGHRQADAAFHRHVHGRRGPPHAGVPEECRAEYALFSLRQHLPAAPEEINLRFMERLREWSGRPVGYSGHDTGTAISLAAVAMGARLLERHLTLDRTMRGPDHKASLEPAQFAEQVRALREVEASIGVPHRWITRAKKRAIAGSGKRTSSRRPTFQHIPPSAARC